MTLKFVATIVLMLTIMIYATALSLDRANLRTSARYDQPTRSQLVRCLP